MIMNSTKTMTSMEAETYQSPDMDNDFHDEKSEDPVTKMHEAAEGEVIVDHLYLRQQVEEYINLTMDARMLSERCRDYYDGKQWTPEQVAALKRRKQAPIVNNRIKVKQNGLLGLLSVRKGDPKAYPRNVDADSGSAEAATDALRYVADKANLNPTFLECGDNFFCEGYTGVNIVTETCPNGDIDIVIDYIPWDRIFFDPFSRKHDFSDARYKGFGIWMDEDDIINTFPDADPSALSYMPTDTDETFQDRPRWSFKSGNRKRFMVMTHYIKVKNNWTLAIYTGGGFLLQPMISPYNDEYGHPTCPIELEHAYIDRENNRYGEIASFIDLQDEINHRRSKALFLLSQRQTFSNRGAVTNVAKAKRELAKPDGHLEVQNGVFNKDFGILPTGDMAQGQFELLAEAKAEIDAQSFNAQLAGQQQGEISGVAIKRLQQAGMTEIIKLFENFGAFKLRVYRQMWYRIRQFWSQEKWVRVTDDQNKLRWVGFNIQVTMNQFLTETMQDESLPMEMRLGASAQQLTLQQTNPQALQQPVMTKNKCAELDIDIILDEAYDSVNVSQEQLDAILKFGMASQFDIVDLLQISNIQDKDKLIEKIETRRQAAAQQPPDPTVAAQAAYLTAKAGQAQADAASKTLQVQAHAQTKQTQVLSDAQIKMGQAQADVQQTLAETEQTKIENEMMVKYPPTVSQQKINA